MFVYSMRICNWSTVTTNACFDAGDGPPHPDNEKPSCSVPLFKVTEVQLKDESFIEKMVFIVQAVWHSKQRIVKQLPRGHANWHACNADLSHVYRQCRPSADEVGMLKGENGEELKKEITQAATQFTASLDAVFHRYSEFVPGRKNSSLSDSISMIHQHDKSGVQIQADACSRTCPCIQMCHRGLYSNRITCWRRRTEQKPVSCTQG